MYKYILRFSLVPGLDFQQKCDSLLEFVDNAQIDDVMFFISPEEVSVGHITIEMAKVWIDPIKKLKTILSEKGVTVSLNPWATLDHYDGGRKLFDGQNFSTLVGETVRRVKFALVRLIKIGVNTSLNFGSIT